MPGFIQFTLGVFNFKNTKWQTQIPLERQNETSLTGDGKKTTLFHVQIYTDTQFCFDNIYQKFMTIKYKLFLQNKKIKRKYVVHSCDFNCFLLKHGEHRNSLSDSISLREF